jgi:hypothetical protein
MMSCGSNMNKKGFMLYFSKICSFRYYDFDLLLVLLKYILPLYDIPRTMDTLPQFTLCSSDFFINFLYGGWGFIVTILIRLILYISYIAPIVSPPQPPPLQLKAIARDFLVCFI